MCLSDTWLEPKNTSCVITELLINFLFNYKNQLIYTRVGAADDVLNVKVLPVSPVVPGCIIVCSLQNPVKQQV